MPPIPDSAVRKYIKIKALADRGADGERENAARALGRLSKEYPGVDRQALELLRREHAAEQRKGVSPGSPFPSDFSFAERPSWEEMFRYAKTVYSYASDFADTVAASQEGWDLSDEVDLNARLSSKGNILLTFRMPLDVFQEAQRLSAIQKQAFRISLRNMLDEKLDELLGEE